LGARFLTTLASKTSSFRLPIRLSIIALTAFGTMLPRLSAQENAPAASAQVRESFKNPPDASRIMMRWWWFGPGVEPGELERELRTMKAAGIGGVEIQPVYPLELDDPKKGFHNSPYLSPEFLDRIGLASRVAKELGMRVDITLGSGWPYGGPDTPITEAAGRLRIERTPVSDAHSLPVPAMENGETLVAAFVAGGDGHQFSTGKFREVSDVQDGRLQVPSGLAGAQTAVFFIASRTGQQVKRASVGAEGYVLDHYSQAAIQHHLTAVGDKLLQAFGPNPPYSVFSDSLEVYGSDWTSDFVSEFQKRRGYDIVPHLPALAGEAGPETMAIRHDWGKTLTELAEERYLTPLRDWAHAHKTLFRAQTYGEPPVVLSSNSLVDLSEGEHGPEWRKFSQARWASSANHLYNRRVTSTETWTWLHAPSFRATPLDMKAEADLHFIQGINQLIGHGWPYSPPAADEPGWRFYASAALNDHNPWFQVMPDITRYLQRVSYLLRQGKPANDVAIYLPTDDAWARFTPGKISVDEQVDALLGPALIPQVLNAGYNFDFIDDRSMESAGLHYRMLILPGVERMPLQTLNRVREYVTHGGVVIATKRLPSLAPGFKENETETPQIKKLTEELFGGSQKKTKFVEDESALGAAMTSLVTPDFSTGIASVPVMGFIHRKLDDSDVYFLVNTSNRPVKTTANVRMSGLGAEWWDPFLGTSHPAAIRANGDRTAVKLDLAPYESRVLVFGNSVRKVSENNKDRGATARDISKDWNVTFSGSKQHEHMNELRSWTRNEATRFYSGTAVYEKTIQISRTELRRGSEYVLDFGPGETVSAPTGSALGMRALLESPVRESALVYINGKPAGSVWHPPYQVNVKPYLHAGANQLRIVVANLAINEMAGHALPDYKLLNLRYGERFVPQGFEGLKELPAGMLGPVELVAK